MSIMNCCQIQGIEELFSQQYVTKELTRYRTKGPAKTTRMLIDAIKEAGAAGLTLLDIGGGVGAIQHDLLRAGVKHATDVDASGAFIAAAKAEAQRRGNSEQVSFEHGNFVEMAADIPPADIVTLDRVICCYPDMEMLVGLSAAHALKLYGVVYPRDSWWIRIGLSITNFFLRIRKSHYRAFTHPTQAVENQLSSSGLKRCFYRQTLVWQVAVFTR